MIILHYLGGSNLITRVLRNEKSVAAVFREVATEGRLREMRWDASCEDACLVYFSDHSPFPSPPPITDLKYWVALSLVLGLPLFFMIFSPNAIKFTFIVSIFCGLDVVAVSELRVQLSIRSLLGYTTSSSNSIHPIVNSDSFTSIPSHIKLNHHTTIQSFQQVWNPGITLDAIFSTNL